MGRNQLATFCWKSIIHAAIQAVSVSILNQSTPSFFVFGLHFAFRLFGVHFSLFRRTVFVAFVLLNSRQVHPASFLLFMVWVLRYQLPDPPHPFRRRPSDAFFLRQDICICFSFCYNEFIWFFVSFRVFFLLLHLITTVFFLFFFISFFAFEKIQKRVFVNLFFYRCCCRRLFVVYIYYLYTICCFARELSFCFCIFQALSALDSGYRKISKNSDRKLH